MPGPRLRRWWLKAAAQGVLAALPGGARLEHRLRGWSTDELTEEYFHTKWNHVTAHTRAATGDPDGDLTGRLLVELGTGWFPIVPLGLALRGADVVTIDLTRHLDPHRVALVLRLMLRLSDAGEITVPDGPRLAAARAVAEEASALPVGSSLASLGVRPALGDARDLSGLPETHGAELLVSNNTLEHIPGDVLEGILAEFHRVGGPGARMSHYIDLADHYAAVDPAIGEFNFLTLSPRRWRLVNNRLHYQNRLRIQDYRSLHERTGWRLVRQHCVRRDATELEGLSLVPPFDTMRPKDLRVVKVHLVSERA
jgi:hypothetical protein